MSDGTIPRSGDPPDPPLETNDFSDRWIFHRHHINDRAHDDRMPMLTYTVSDNVRQLTGGATLVEGLYSGAWSSSEDDQSEPDS